MRAKHITIKDLSRILNVSVSTISRAFNDKSDIRKETRKLVLQKAMELGYRPNPMARNLQKQISKNIGIIVPELIGSFFPLVISGMEEVFSMKGYQMLILSSYESFEKELERIKTLEDSMVDGIIISLSRETKNVDVLNQLIQTGIPLVTFNRTNPDIKAPRIIFDDYKWALLATEHLIIEGCNNIYHFALPFHLSISKRRIEGFKKAMTKYCKHCNDLQIIESGISLEDGRKTMQILIEQSIVPDGIFASSDRLAIGAIQVLKENGYKVPEDCRVMGFSESTLATIIEPQLSTVTQPTKEMGKKTAEMMIRLLESEVALEPETIKLNGKIKVRQSTRV
ncbi:MAG: LacI family DNA-binding transcriptional regulator [Bacteroidales bacterium]|nr:LacI family DNA-binding transcriptional regulator [Bacteroidales bacterium]MDT8430718.1 LacI family DNA-binding transcriptional regulator [Bacteroidales bacterium]